MGTNRTVSLAASPLRSSKATQHHNSLA